MNEKVDGRLYSRIMRRSVAILKMINAGQLISINDLAKLIHNKKPPPPEFYLDRFKRQMSVIRTKDYIRYLIDLNALSRQDDNYTLNFSHRTNDEEWAQGLSDLALPHLAKLLSKNPIEVEDFLKDARNKIFNKKKLPTLDEILEHTSISGSKEKEYFKWSLYMYVDVDTCPFDIRRYPSLVIRGE